jgi:hypothetical protein
MALKNAFWTSPSTVSMMLAFGLSSRPVISTRVATSSRGRFCSTREMPPTIPS